MAHHGVNDYMAHGFCLLWEPTLVWLHVISDIATGLAYYSIPFAIFYFLYKRRDLPFPGMFVLFGIFIFACGTTHLLAAYTIYKPIYWSQGYVKAFTALVSVASAFLFIPYLPKAIALPSLTKALEEIKTLNTTLEKQVGELELFRNLLNQANDALFVVDPETGLLLDVNAKACSSLGYGREELLKMNIFDIQSDIPDSFLWKTHVNEVKNKGHVVIEGRLKRKDNRTFPIEVNVSHVSLEKRDYMVAVVRDITERKQAEEELRRSEKKYKDLFESTLDGIYQVDADGDFILMNPAGARIFGYEGPEEIIGTNALEYWRDPKDRDVFRAELKVKKTVSTYYMKAKKKTGEPIELEASSRIREDEKGNFLGVEGILRDVTERKLAEEALRRSEEQLKEAQHLAHIGSWELNIVANRLFWSDEIYRIFEIDKNDFGASYEAFLAMVHPDDREAVDKAYKTSVRDKIPYEIVHRLKFPDGRVKFVQEGCETFYHVGGDPLRSIGTVQDITERKKAEMEREQYFRFFQTSADLMCIADPNGAFLKTNPACSEQLGYSETELVAKPFIEFVHPDDKQSTVDEMARQLQKGFSLNFENRYICKDGSVRWLSWRAIFNKDEGITYATARDITERKRAEEELVRLYQQVKDEAGTSSSLLSMFQALNSSLDEKELIKTVLNLAPRYLRFDRIGIFLYDESVGGFAFSGGYGFRPAEEGILLSRSFRAGDFPAVDKIIKGETLVIENAAGSDLISNELVDALDIKDALSVPISARGKVIGGIYGDYRTMKPIERKDVSFLQGLADGVAIALQNSRLYRESIERLMELSGKIETIKTMAMLEREILSTIDRATILQTAVALVNRIIPCERASVLVREGNNYRVISEWGVGRFLDKVYSVKNSHYEVLETQRKSLFIPDLATDGTNCLYHREQNAIGVRSSLLVPLVTRGETIGSLDIGSTFHGRLAPAHLSTAENIGSQVTVALENARLYEELQQLLINTITSLASAIDAKSPWTKGHSERVTQYALQIGTEMGLKDEELERLKLSGLLHDVGKIGTYDILLDKPGKLTDEEFALVKKHPQKGVEILGPIKQLSDIIPGVHHHHERYDGKGYPDGLKGEEIPLQARILCVADSYDSMTADRPYRPAPGKEYAISEFKRCLGTQFDPNVVEAFLKILSPDYS